MASDLSSRNPADDGDRDAAGGAYLSNGRDARPAHRHIGDSWQRSQQLGLDPEDLSRAGDSFDEETQVAAYLNEAVDTVLLPLSEQLAGEPVSVLFAEPNGQILRRFCGDTELRRKLDTIYLAPGCGYGEQHVGTNGIGTTLERLEPTQVIGREHYNQQLRAFACAGAPIRHPLSGNLLGVIDVTCEAEQVNPLLMATARWAAQRIENELLHSVSEREIALLRDYLAACRRATGPILAFGGDVVMMNRHAQDRLSSQDRAALLARTGDAMHESNPRMLVADLPSGATARLSYKPSMLGEQVIGGVYRIQVREADPKLRTSLASDSRPVGLPGLVGVTPEWQRISRTVAQANRAEQSLLIEGEPGVGKFSLARAAHLARDATAPLRVIECRRDLDDADVWLNTVEQQLSEPNATIVLRRIESLPAEVAGALSELLLEAAAHDDGCWIVATRDPDIDNPDVSAKLAPCFDRSVQVPPLRHRPDDIAVLARELLVRVSRGAPLRLSGPAIAQLSRLPWRGNVAELGRVLQQVIRVRRTGVVTPADLPAQCHSATRRSLTPLEALERDAIVQSLRDHDGNKTSAAAHLGMSRATIYRKIRDFGIDSDAACTSD